MCNRYALSVPAASLFPRYNATESANPVAAPATELFPRKPAYVVRDAEDVDTLDVMAWGFPMMTKAKSGKEIRTDVTNARMHRSPFRASIWLSLTYPTSLRHLPALRHWLSCLLSVISLKFANARSAVGSLADFEASKFPANVESLLKAKYSGCSA